MRLASLKRPKVYVPLLVVLVLLLVVFHPAVQRKAVLSLAESKVDQLDLDYIHLTPWSLELKRLNLGYEGGKFRLASGDIGFCPLALVTKTLSVKRLFLDKLAVDLSEFDPPPSEEPPDDKPFPGVLALSDTGLRLKLQALRVDSHVTLGPEQTVAARVTGGGIAPEETGLIHLDVGLTQGAPDQKKSDKVDVKGPIYLKQLKSGQFDALGVDLLTDLQLAALPSPEQVDLKVKMTPLPVPDDVTRLDEDGEEVPLLAKERIQAAIVVRQPQQNDQATLVLDGIYDGNPGVIKASYGLQGNEALVSPFVEGPLPVLRNGGGGQVVFDLVNTKGVFSLVNRLAATDLEKILKTQKAPEKLSLTKHINAQLANNQLYVKQADILVTDAKQNEWVTTELSTPLQIDLDDPQGFLKHDRQLATIKLQKIALDWLEGFMPGKELTGGALDGGFKVSSDRTGKVLLTPEKALTVSGLNITEQGKALINDLNLSLSPSLDYGSSGINVETGELLLSVGNTQLADAEATVALPGQEAGQAGKTRVQAKGRLFVNALANLVSTDTENLKKLPRGLSLSYQAKAAASGDNVDIQQVDVDLSQGQSKGTGFLSVKTVQPFSIALTDEGQQVKSAGGQVAHIDFNDLNLAWLSPFVPELDIAGIVDSGQFGLSIAKDQKYVLGSNQPLTIAGLDLTQGGKALLKGLSISVRPQVEYAPELIKASYDKLRVKSKQGTIVSGGGSAVVVTAKDAAPTIDADGQLNVDLQVASQQPALLEALGATVTKAAKVDATYTLKKDAKGINIRRLLVQLIQDGKKPKIELSSKQGILLGTGGSGSPASYGKGAMELNIDHWEPTPFEDILATNNIRFSEMTGRAWVSSDGKAIKVENKDPFQIVDLQVKDESKKLTHPFTVQLRPSAAIDAKTINASIDELTVTFEGEEEKAIDGKIALELAQGEKTWLNTLSVDLLARLPILLDQPAVMPSHTLRNGDFKSNITVDRQGNIAWNTDLEDIKGKSGLALSNLAIHGTGRVEKDGGFSLDIPLKTLGKSGKSDVVVHAAYAPKEEADLLNINVDGKSFYLNDILSLLEAIKGLEPEKVEEPEEQPEAQEEDKDKVVEKLEMDLTPHEKAIWDVLPAYDTKVAFKLDELYYTDYLMFNGIKGDIDLTSQRAALNDFTAFFHESPIQFDGGMSFSAGQAEPYDLKIVGSTKKFDLHKFFTELVPGSTPQAEGLFTMDFDIFGSMPNIEQFRNYFFMDLALESVEGIFRPLPPDNALMMGASNVLGVVGDGVSFIPTNLFGAGAVSRLVGYIKEIEYDRIDIHITRDDSRDLVIEELSMTSPEILFAAAGDVKYQEGVDLLDSPLTLSATMNMKRKGAAILYNLNLLHDAKDDRGYWKGTQFKLWGSIRDIQSNFSDVITQAGKDTLKGGVTRPISGIVGNVKYWWLGDDDSNAEPSNTEE